MNDFIAILMWKWMREARRVRLEFKTDFRFWNKAVSFKVVPWSVRWLLRSSLHHSIVGSKNPSNCGFIKLFCMTSLKSAAWIQHFFFICLHFKIWLSSKLQGVKSNATNCLFHHHLLLIYTHQGWNHMSDFSMEWWTSNWHLYLLTFCRSKTAGRLLASPPLHHRHVSQCSVSRPACITPSSPHP